jgi:hypothetical protein
LSSARTGGFGPNPIQFSEIKAYYSLLGIEPNLFEVKLIQAFDSEFLKHCQEVSKSTKDK